MLSFHPLTLTRRQPIAEDAFCLELRADSAGSAAFRFDPGQHLPVRAMVSGRELRRTYSIVGAAGESLRIGVRVQGEMSRYLTEELAIGGRLEAMEPTGRFRPTLDPARSGRYAAFAAGSGITPVLPIVAAILGAEQDSRVTLFYGNRSAARAMFLEEVLALKDRYLERFAAHFLMSREPQDVELFNGRLDGAKLRALAATEFDPHSIDEYFICGPGAMVKDLSAALRAFDATGKIHVERFSIDAGPAAAASVTGRVGAASGAGTEVQVTMDGRRRAFRMSRDERILEAGERAGLTLPFSCRAGVCSTCRAKLVAGTVEMERNQALEDWEVQAGFVLCCQARPTSSRIEITYDEK
ncbi:MAG TPA: 2Fe-2S iron-sulfur cluster-binding protein [Steroidobacteraceae bacterium]|nr:2Fe-2S iron-sulfur cluster-binding protein [Steroidobacteraceae bacterium]